MGLVISRANSIHFVEVNTDLPNIENTLSFDERYAAFTTKDYCQKWQHDDVVTVQITSDVATSPLVEVLAPELLGTRPVTLKTSYTDRYYFEFTIDFSSYTDKHIQIRVTQGAIVWLSEVQENSDLDSDLDLGYLLKCEYTNKDQPSAVDNVQIDYTTGIEFFLYFEAQSKDAGYSGEDEIFVNVSETKLIASQLFKTRQLKTDFLPEFMLDKITLAGKHFLFIINDLRYVANELPDLTQTGSNRAALEWTLTHNEILGLSTDDKGLNDTDMTDFIIIEKDDAITGSWSFTLLDGYVFHLAVCGHGAGSAAAYTIAIGTTVGGDELWASGVTTVALGTIEEIVLHEQQAFQDGGDQTIYITLTGGGAVGKIYCQLIKNYED